MKIVINFIYPLDTNIIWQIEELAPSIHLSDRLDADHELLIQSINVPVSVLPEQILFIL